MGKRAEKNKKKGHALNGWPIIEVVEISILWSRKFLLFQKCRLFLSLTIKDKRRADSAQFECLQFGLNSN